MTARPPMRDAYTHTYRYGSYMYCIGTGTGTTPLSVGVGVCGVERKGLVPMLLRILCAALALAAVPSGRLHAASR